MARLTDADVLRFKASEPVTGAAPSEALMAFQTAYQTAKAAYMAAMKGNERLACLQGLGTIQNMTAALAGLAPEHADNLSAIGSKAMRLLPVIKSEAVKEDVLHKARFEKGKPADPTKHMSEEDADKWKAMNDEHKDNFKSADFKDGKPQCDDDRNCKEPVAFKDSKGYIYCQKHGERLKKAGRPGVLPLSKAAIKKLEEQAQGEKTASGRTKHLSGKKGYTLCGEEAHKDTIVDSVTDSTCHYCVSAWEKAHGGHR
jgi:hypothetical protein